MIEACGPKAHTFEARPSAALRLNPSSSGGSALALRSLAEIPKKLHWVWVGETPIASHDMFNVLEIARLAPSFEKTIWTNHPQRIFMAAHQSSIGFDFDLAAHLKRCKIKIRSIDELFRNVQGFSARELTRLASIVMRETRSPLANCASASDVLRLLALHKDGGIYADVDFDPHRKAGAALLHDCQSPTSAQRRAQIFASLETSRTFTSESSKNPFDALRINRNLLKDELKDVPEHQVGFIYLNAVQNNSLIAAARASKARAASSITGRALKAILAQSIESKLTLREAHQFRHTLSAFRLPPEIAAQLPRYRKAVTANRAAMRETLHELDPERAQSAATWAMVEATGAIDLPTKTQAKLQIKKDTLYMRFFQGRIDYQVFIKAHTSLNAGYFGAPYVTRKNFGLTAYRKPKAALDLPLAWQAKRLRPVDAAGITIMRTGHNFVPAPCNALTQTMTGPPLLLSAALADPQVASTIRLKANALQAEGRAEFWAFAAARLRAIDSITASHPFFVNLPPCDTPHLRPLQDIAYARDAP